MIRLCLWVRILVLMRRRAEVRVWFFFSSRRRHTRCSRDWSSDVCSSDLFCTVTGFFGDSIRFRTNESVVNELLLLKARAREEGGQIAVFFIDDNFAINVKRTKSLLGDIIAADAQVHRLS